MSLDVELRRAEQARQLLQNEMYQDAIGQVKQAILDKWVSCSIRDKEGQHELKIMLKMLENITHYIQTALETGKMAEIQLETERRMTKLHSVGL